jgi:hypothetical protein
VALLGLFIYGNCHGTHITGGEITFMRDPNASNPYAYLFTLKIYRDTQGPDAPNATLYLGVEGSEQTVPVGIRQIVGQQAGNFMEVLIYSFRYTYPAAGTYTVSFTEENREAEIVNMMQSVTTPLHIRTTFTISPTAGANNGPQLLNPPLFRTVAGREVCINAAAYDPDGDSLSYRLAVPLEKPNVPVKGYQLPNQVMPLGVSESGGAPAFTINELTGDICWDAPGLRKRGGGVLTDPYDYAHYAIAFVVDEWRNGNRLSSTVRDFMITVTGPEVPAPELRAENAEAAGFNAQRQVRLEPGQHLSFSVLYKSPLPDLLDSLVLVSETRSPYGNATAMATDSAGFTKMTYTWTPTEVNRRRQPYLLVFRGGSFKYPTGELYFNDLTFTVYVGTDIPAGRVTATEDEVKGRRIKLYPNPTRDKVRLAEVPGAGAVYFQLTDALGREVYASPNLRGTNFEVGLATLPHGLYAYTITAGQRVVGKGRLLKR